MLTIQPSKVALLGLFLCLTQFLHAQKAPFEAILKYYETEKNFNGVVLVASEGKIDFLKAAGIAHRESGTPMTTQSRFKICSITKTFTAALILQLVDEGKLDLNEKVGRYLPEFQGDAKNKSSLLNLLTYSSGLENTDQQSDAMYQSKLSPDSIIKRFCSGPLVSEPGTQFSYTNYDYILLGKVIERVTGKSFEDNLRTRLLLPLGMTHSGMLRNEMVLPGLVSGYVRDSNGVFLREDLYWIDNFYAAGAMYSTIEDLLKFDQAIFSGRLFRPQTLELMLTAYPQLWGVAIGFWVNPVEFGTVKSTVADRRGSIGGINTNWIHLREQGKTILIFSNTDATDLVEMREKFALAVLKQPVKLGKK